MDLSMSILQYLDYLSMLNKKKIDAVFEELRSGEYQKRAIREYNKKYPLLKRLSANYPETEHIKACQKSLKSKRTDGHCSTYDDKLTDPLLKKISEESDEMFQKYEKCFLHKIEEKAKNCDKALVKKIADKCYNQFELEIKKDWCYLEITDTFIRGTFMEVPLSSIGVNPIRGKFEQAGLAAAVLAELRERYKSKSKKILVISMSSDSADDPEELTNRMINEGKYTRGNSYITILLSNKDYGSILNI